jgi:mRNA interferase MazF
VVISQGEVYWVDFGKPKGSTPGFRRPCLVIQNDSFNRSAISTTVVAALTSNLRLGQSIGNVTLRKGEAGLSKRSVVNISQLTTVDRSMLTRRIGRLSSQRLREILLGIYALLEPVA